MTIALIIIKNHDKNNDSKSNNSNTSNNDNKSFNNDNSDSNYGWNHVLPMFYTFRSHETTVEA